MQAIHIKKYVLSTILLWAGMGSIFAQPFSSDIRKFQVADSLHKPPAHAILFVGSSSFTFWQDVNDYFPGKVIINRGFGGSTLQDVTRYERQVIFPYAPRQIVMYCGENDIANDSTVTGKVVFKRFRTLFKDIRKQFPNIPFAYISMKPSPSRTHLAAKMKDGNARIKQYLSTKQNTNYIDIYDAMLENGRPISRIFKADSLHMNAQGYQIWQKIIAPVLQ